MERAFKVGCQIVFFDSLRQAHSALVTEWFHGGPPGQTVDEMLQEAKDRGVDDPKVYMPCCNIVFVSTDQAKHDPYGRQIERHTSVSYGRNLGMCWAWPDELEEAKALAAKALL